MTKKEKDLEQEVKEEIKEEKVSVDKDTQEAWDKKTPEERDKLLAESSEESESPSEDKPEISPEVEKPKEVKEDDYEFLKDGKVRVGKEVFASKEEAIKSFHNLRGLDGKRAAELGDLRSQVLSKEVLPEPEKEIELPEFDESTPYDKEKLTTYIAAVAERIASEKTGNTMTQMMVRAKDERNLQKFVEDNSDLTADELKDVAKYGDEHGISNFQESLNAMRRPDDLKKAKLTGRQEILAELNQKTLKPSLSGLGAGDSDTPQDIEEISPEKWAKMPQSERDKYLEAA